MIFFFLSLCCRNHSRARIHNITFIRRTQIHIHNVREIKAKNNASAVAVAHAQSDETAKQRYNINLITTPEMNIYLQLVQNKHEQN